MRIRRIARRRTKRCCRGAASSRAFIARSPRASRCRKRTQIANAQKSKVRSAVEHVFAQQKGPMGLFVRTIGLARARLKIGLANLAYNIRRFVWLSARGAPA